MSEESTDANPWFFSAVLPDFLTEDSILIPQISLLVLLAGFLIPLTISRWRWHPNKQKKCLPGPWSWPLFGHVRTLTQDAHTKLTSYHQLYGDIYQLTVGQHKVVVIGSLDGLMEGLHDRSDSLSGRPDFQNFNFLYDAEENRQRGVCCADNSEKTHVRRNFLSSSVDAYCSDVQHIEEKLSSEIIDTVNRLVESQCAFDPMAILKPACFNIIFRLVFDQRLDPQCQRMRETLALMDSRREAFRLNPLDFCPLLKIFSSDDFGNYIQESSTVQLSIIHKYLNLHKDTYDHGHIRDMADHLLLYVDNGEDVGLLGKEDLDYLLLDALNFGYNDTAVVLTWLLGYMASHADIQRQVQRELDSVIDHSRLPGVEDQPYLPLTTACIYEALRLASIHPFLIPHSATKDTTLQDYPIQTGSILLFNVWKIHHDAKLWKNPYQYNPHRFLNKSRALEIPDHFIPYGAGRRQCPGEGLADVMLFLFFATIMQQLSIKPDQGFPLLCDQDIVLKPKAFTLTVSERIGIIKKIIGILK